MAWFYAAEWPTFAPPLTLEVALRQGALDRLRFSPKTFDIAGVGQGPVIVGKRPAVWYTPELAQDIFSITPGKAGDEDSAIALAQGKARPVVSMGWATAHGDPAMPLPAEGSD